MNLNPERKKMSKGVKIAIVAIAIIILAFILFNTFYINILWFKETGYLQVFFKELITRVSLFIPVFAVLFVLLSIYFKLLTKSRNPKPVKIVDNMSFVKRKLPYIISLVVSFIMSAQITSSLWYKWLEFKNSVPFNVTDPVFSKDVSFYVFRLPFYQSLISIGYFTLAILAISTLIYSAVVIYNRSTGLYREQDEFDLRSGLSDHKSTLKEIVSTYRVQLSIFLGLFFLLFAFSNYIKRYSVLYSPTGVVYGAGYTDVMIRVPMYFLFAGVAVVAAFLLVYFGIKKKIRPLALTLAAIIGIQVIGFGVGAIVQAAVVSPNEYTKETEYLKNNIEFTQKAYGLDNIETKEFPANEEITAKDIKNNETTIHNIPINDYSPTLDTYNSLQGIRPYYRFNDIDVDRYMLDDEYTQVFISPRELDSNRLNDSAKNWINTHLKYTHGFGVTVSPVNKVTKSGQPVMISKDIPAKSDYEQLKLIEPRIYFGELTDEYAIVNTESGEFDYPKGSNNAENIYDGDAGIKLNLLNKICFSMRYATMKFLLSSDVTSESKILIHRNILQRVNKIAPFLSYDNDPYAVIDQGRVYWVIDAMTKTNLYPYSQPYDQEHSYNYIRNSVKIVVDAYNGDVTFYRIDENDPIASVYAKIYPNLFKTIEDMPKGIRSHLRYSETLFTIQSQMYNTYHMENPGVFYNKEDLWQIANQYYGTSQEPVKVNASYMIMKLPDREEEFMLVTPFTPKNKDNMVAWMAGICDGKDYGKLIVYQFPKQSLVYGPMQIEKRINQDTAISPQLTLLGQEGSNILRGNLQTIPIEGGLLYVEPIYIQANGEDKSLPEAKLIIVSYADKIVMANTLNEALAEIFDIKNYEENTSPENGETATPPEKTQKELINEANSLFVKSQEAIKQGDWAKYGEYIEKLGKVLNRLAK